MLRKLKLFVIIAIAVILAIPFNACQRLNGRAEEVINEEKEDKEKEDEPVVSEKPEEKALFLVPFAQNNGFDATYGYKDQAGNSVIEPQFKRVEPFFESGVAPVVELTGKTGLIDKTGSYIVEPQWDYISYNEDLFIGSQYENNISALFDKNGKMLFQIEGYIADYSEGLSPFYSESESGYLDKSGKLALKLDYAVMDYFRNGIAEVAPVYWGPSHYIDKNGNDLTDTVSSGLRMYKDEANNLFGFKNQQGDIVINAEYYEASPFMNGYAFVSVASASYNYRYGIIDTAGKQVLEPKYCGIVRLSNGLIAVGEEVSTDTYIPDTYFTYCKKALFTPDLKNSTEFIFDSVVHFDNENVCVNDNSSIYFINQELEQSKKLPKMSGRGLFKKDGGEIRGYFNGKLTVFDTKGKLLTQDSGDIVLGDGILSSKQVELPTPVTTLRYPVISRLQNNSLEKQINDAIFYEMIESYKDLVSFNGPENTIYLDSDYVITREKNLILIDQDIYTYLLGANHGYSYRNTVYIDIKTGIIYKLADLFNSDSGAFDYLSDAVTNQIQEQMDEMGYFVGEVAIKPDTAFAVKQDGIVIYYAEGDIASYAAGMQEFFIPFSDLTAYINTQGDFWKSFK